MTEHSIVLLAGMATIATLALVIYLSSRGQGSALTVTREVRRILDQILAGNRNIERTLEQQRHVLNDAHKRIHAVSKRPRKTPFVNPMKSMAGSPDPAVQKGIGLETPPHRRDRRRLQCATRPDME